MSVRKNIISVLAEYGIELKNEGSILRAYCPFHQDTGRPNFTVYEDTDSWYCWACKEGGDKYQFVAKFEGISYNAAKAKFEGEQIELQEIQEKIDGVDPSEDTITTAVEINILVSKMARKFLYEHPHKTKEVLAFLKDFDVQLLKPITMEMLPNIIKNASQTLKSFV